MRLSGKFQQVLWAWMTLSVFVVLQMGYFASQTMARNTPFNAEYSVSIDDTPSSKNTFGVIASIAKQHGLLAAKQTYITGDAGTEIEIYTNHEKHLATYRYANERYTAIVTSDKQRDIGFWIFWGDKANFERLQQELTAQGFVFNISSTGSILAMIVENKGNLTPMLVALLGVFLTATLSYSHQIKLVSVRELLGVVKTRAIFRETAYSIGVLGAVTLILLLGFLAFLGLNSAAGLNIYLFANYLKVVDFVGVFVLVTVAALVLAQILVWLPKHSLIARLKGKRPYKLIAQIAVMVFAVAVTSVLNSGYLAARQLNVAATIAKAQSLWENNEAVHTFDVAYSTEELLAKYFNSVKNMTEQADKYNLQVIYSADYGDCSKNGETNSELTCLFVSPSYLDFARISGKHVAGTTDVYLPVMDAEKTAMVRENVIQNIEFQLSFLPASDKLEHSQGKRNFITKNLGNIPIYRTTFVGKQVVENPVLVVTDLSSISGDNMLSALTSGNMMFIGEKENVERALKDNQLDELGIEITNPIDEAKESYLRVSQLLEDTTRNLVFGTLVMLVGLAGYGLAYVLQCRKIISLQRLLGYTSTQIFRKLFLQVLLLTFISCAVGINFAGENIMQQLPVLIACALTLSALCTFVALVYEKYSMKLFRDLGK